MKLYKLEKNDKFVIKTEDKNCQTLIFLGCDGMYGKVKQIDKDDIGFIACYTDVEKIEPSKKLYLDEIEDRDEKNRLERENLFKKIKGEKDE
jgi:hypothetical protein